MGRESTSGADSKVRLSTKGHFTLKFSTTTTAGGGGTASSSIGSGGPVPAPRAPPSYSSIRQEVIKDSSSTIKQENMNNSVGNSVGASGGTGSLLDSLLNGSNNDTVQKLAMLAYVTNPDKGQPIMQGLLTAQLVKGIQPFVRCRQGRSASARNHSEYRQLHQGASKSQTQ